MSDTAIPIENNVEESLKNMMPLIKLQQMIARASTESSSSFSESIISFIDENGILGENKGQLYEFLTILSNASESHFKSLDLIILLFKNYQEIITSNFSSDDLFSIFSSNKTLLLSLYENKCINISTLQKKFNSSSFQFPFFYPEFKSNFDILTSEQKEQIQAIDKEIQEKYESKIDIFLNFRKEGHSEMTIAKLIRDDDIDKFTVFVSPENFDLNMTIPLSIFESHPLLQSEPTLIEYACFFGSIKIFKFLWLRELNINKRIFEFAIAGKNFEIIHIIENKCKTGDNEINNSNKIIHKKSRYRMNDFVIDNDCLFAAINYQQPEVFDYFIEKYNDLKLTETMLPKIIESHNFLMFQYIIQYILKETPNCQMSITSNYKTEIKNFSIDQILKMKDNLNKNFLHFACIYGNIEIVDFLCKYKSSNDNDFLINVNEKDNSNWTPLHYACKYNYFQIVEILANCYGKLLDFNCEDDDFKFSFSYMEFIKLSIFFDFGLL